MDNQFLSKEGCNRVFIMLAQEMCRIANDTGCSMINMEMTPPEEENALPGTVFRVTIERVCACERCQEPRDEEERMNAADNENFDPIVHLD